MMFGQEVLVKAKPAVGNALTTVLAGFALTTTSWPNIIFLPAFVAGFFFVLILTRPGIVKTPVFLTSVVPTSANAPKSFEMTLFFTFSVSSAAARAPLVMAFAATAFFTMAMFAE